MSPRKILIACSSWSLLAFGACRVAPPADEKVPSIDFFSEENAPGFWSLPDVIELRLKRPVLQYPSTITSEIIPIEAVTVDDPQLKERLIYYGATGVSNFRGAWQVHISKFCHFVGGVTRDFAQVDVVESAEQVSSGFGLEDVMPYENGHNVMAPRVWVSLERGSQDVCDAKIFLRVTGVNGGELMSPTHENPVTDPATQHTGCYFYGISETPGIYDLEIAADGYASTHVTNVEIVLDDKLCHVIQKEIRVTLKKK